jgi:hypothetical protein
VARACYDPSRRKAWAQFKTYFKNVPLATVLRERVALADQKYEAALREVEQLKQVD